MLRCIVRGGHQLSAESMGIDVQTSCSLHVSSRTARRMGLHLSSFHKGIDEVVFLWEAPFIVDMHDKYP